MKKNVGVDKWKKDPELRVALARRNLAFLSRELQEFIADGFAREQTTRLDDTLNALKPSRADEATRQNLLLAIRKELPSLPAKQAEEHLWRAFRHKVNSLRCLGRKPVLLALQGQSGEAPQEFKRRRMDTPANGGERPG
ncbi:unnamed protein product [Symbiodinium microadriaticum]|nr:unnamed protein product [Symbiodinium microadriaticum]